MKLEFDDCLLDLARRELVRASKVIGTAPQVFDLLVFLAQRRERVVSKDELINAIWTGRIVSESTLASHISAARKAVGDDGQQQRVLRTVARKGFRFVADVTEHKLMSATDIEPAPPTQNSAPSPDLPSKPSIAVLPFVNLSGDQEQDYLADGVVEDIIVALSQYRWLFVVARNSSFTYKNRMVDVKQVGRELGVRYVLEGSWRTAKNRVRITGQLIDTTSGTHHWAGRFEGVVGDIFALQDQFTEAVVGAIAPQLELAEIDRARHKSTENLDAYDYYLRGIAKLHQGTRETIDQAITLLKHAIKIDPEFASAYAMAAWCYCWRKANGWMIEQEQETSAGILLARQAVEFQRGDAVALTRSGHAIGYLANDLDSGIALLDKALALNPNLSATWFLGAFLRLWNGETVAAIDHFTRAMRLSPLDPELYRMQGGISVAYLFTGHFDTATSWAEKACRELPNFLLAVGVLAASNALSGRINEAHQAMDRMRQLDPNLCLSNINDWLPIRRSADLALLTDGLRLAGMPE